MFLSARSPFFQQKTNISLLMIMLAMLMFNAGLGLKISHLKNILRKQYVLLAGLAANLAIPIVYVFGITIAMRLWYEPIEVQHILVGLALVAAMPIAGSSTAWAQNANGNLALSLGLVFFSTILSPSRHAGSISRIWRNGLGGVRGGIAGSGSVWFRSLSGSLGGVSVIAGHRGAVDSSRGWQTSGMPYLKFINSIVLLLLNYSNASVSLPQAMAEGDYDFLAITLAITAGLCCTLFAAGYGMSRFFKLDQAERVSLMFGLGMNNNGTGLVLASLALSSYPNIMVPIIFYNLVQHIAAGTVQEIMSRRSNDLDA